MVDLRHRHDSRVSGRHWFRALWKIRGSEDDVSGFLRSLEPVSHRDGDTPCTSESLGRQPERKRLRSVSSALPVRDLDAVCGAPLAGAGGRKRRRGVDCGDRAELDNHGFVETKQDDCSCGLSRDGVGSQSRVEPIASRVR